MTFATDGNCDWLRLQGQPTMRGDTVSASALAVLFRDFLNQMRKARGWSVQTLATTAGLPLGTVNSYVISGPGSRLPTFANAVALARAFGESVAIFEECEDFQPSGSDEVTNSDS